MNTLKFVRSNILLILIVLTITACMMDNSNKNIDETIQELSTKVGKNGVQGVVKNKMAGEEVIKVYYLKNMDSSQLDIPNELNGFKIIKEPSPEIKKY